MSRFDPLLRMSVLDELMALRQLTDDPEVKRVARRAVNEIERLKAKIDRIRRACK